MTKDIYKCCTRSGEKWLCEDDMKRFTAIKKNDPAQLDDKAKWIKFTTKNLHKWYKQMVFEVMQKNKLTE